VLCEGVSEETYVICLNKFLDLLQDIKIRFVPKVIGGYRNAARFLKKIKNENRNAKNDKYVVWLDEDVFKRGEANVPKILKDILRLNQYNFEDFLVMHLDKDSVMKWQGVCDSMNHFSVPITSEKCKACVTEILINYEKGSMPDNLEMNAASLKNLFNNQADEEIRFTSDFAALLKELIVI
jgi:hypothetical protein